MTEMQIQYLGNDSVWETEEHLSRRLLGNHKEVNTGCYRKRRVLCEPFSSSLGILIGVMELPGIISHCVILSS